jgi:hypothetical protein
MLSSTFSLYSCYAHALLVLMLSRLALLIIYYWIHILYPLFLYYCSYSAELPVSSRHNGTLLCFTLLPCFTHALLIFYYCAYSAELPVSSRHNGADNFATSFTTRAWMLGLSLFLSLSLSLSLSLGSAGLCSTRRDLVISQYQTYTQTRGGSGPQKKNLFFYFFHEFFFQRTSAPSSGPVPM